MNYLIAQGFAEYGYPEAAERIHQDTLKLAELSGFSEYYHPATGAGLGGGEFSWTAAMALWWEVSPWAH
jgi:alpha,alpha-trehalase